MKNISASLEKRAHTQQISTPSQCRRAVSSKMHGQVMVLGVFLMLFLCFVLFSSLGMAVKTRERIRLQNAADASAYSESARIARAFNYFAYTNRAIASNLVSLTTLHAYHSEISAAKGLYWNLALAYESITAEEIALTTCVMGIGPCQFGCFAHAAADEITAISLMSKNSDFEQDIKDLDSSFEKAVSGYEKSIQLIQLGQQAVRLELLGESAEGILSSLGGTAGLSGGESLDQKMMRYNLPSGHADQSQISLLNLKNLQDSMKFDDSGDAQMEMTEVANASRPLWVRNRLIGGNTATLSPLFSRIKDDTSGLWTTTQIPILEGASGIYDKKPSAIPFPTRPKSKTKGKGIGSVDYWEMTGVCEHNHAAGSIIQPFPLAMMTPGLVYSSSENSSHNLHNSDVSHELDVEKLLRFMRFDIDANGRYRQPVIYKHFRQDLSLNEQGKHHPWDIFDSGKFHSKLFGPQHNIDVRFRPDQEGRALSKAAVYYHHPGNWREPPNFWNPFWRAKLHPFSKKEWLALEALTQDVTGGPGFLLLSLLTDSNDAAMEGISAGAG